MEEIFICTQHLEGMSYSDVLMMPTYERRYFLSLYTKQSIQREEKMEELRQKGQSSGGKGERKTKISGSQLKERFRSGDMPLK